MTEYHLGYGENIDKVLWLDEVGDVLKSRDATVELAIALLDQVGVKARVQDKVRALLQEG